jgi:hypothetical protein
MSKAAQLLSCKKYGAIRQFLQRYGAVGRETPEVAPRFTPRFSILPFVGWRRERPKLMI